MSLKKTVFLAMIIPLMFFVASPASAQGLLPTCATDVNAVLKLSCFLELLASVSKWIFGISGSLALLYFIYGGFVFLTSQGNPNKVGEGKTILTRAVIGIIIIFGAYLAVDFLTKSAGFQEAKFQVPEDTKTPQAPAVQTTTVSYGCFCAYQKPDIATGKYVSAENMIKTYSTAKACEDACDLSCINTPAPGVNPPANYIRGYCKSAQ